MSQATSVAVSAAVREPAPQAVTSTAADIVRASARSTVARGLLILGTPSAPDHVVRRVNTDVLRGEQRSRAERVQVDAGAVAVAHEPLVVGDDDGGLGLGAGRLPGGPLVGELLEEPRHREPAGVAG